MSITSEAHLSGIRWWLTWIFLVLGFICGNLFAINNSLDKIARSQAIIASPPK